jgi:glutamine synthetase
MDTEELLERLEQDGVEHLWVTYHDYSGVACAKSVPKEGFRGAVEGGIVFARANLNFDATDHQPPDAHLLADSGDFLAVPDPDSYAVLPRYPRTARVHAWMRREDGSRWEGCALRVSPLGRRSSRSSTSWSPTDRVATRQPTAPGCTLRTGSRWWKGSCAR